MAKDKEQPLTEKQLAFCENYIIDFNQTQSAIRAGYSKKTAGATASRLLTNVKIIQEVKRLTEERSKRTGITADRVVEQLGKIAFMNVRDVVEWGVDKQKVKDKKGREKEVDVHYVNPVNSDQVDGTLIQSVKMGKYGVVVEIPDRMRAIEMLAKHLGVYDDRPTTEVNIEPYAKAIKEAVSRSGDIWDGFDNGGPDGDDDGEG